MDELILENENPYMKYGPRYLLELLIAKWNDIDKENRAKIVVMLKGDDNEYRTLHSGTNWEYIDWSLANLMKSEQEL